MRRVSEAERILTYIAIALAAMAAAYLLFTLLSEHETCYGMQAGKLLCQPVDALAAARGALVLLFPGVLFVGAAVGALWQTRAKAPDARSTAFGLLVTSALLLVGIIMPALSGAGLFLAPAAALMFIVALLGAVKFVQDWRAGIAQPQ
jgi:tellurite resistance protein TehA-like permease